MSFSFLEDYLNPSVAKNFDIRTAPLADFTMVTVLSTAYLGVVYLSQRWMANREPMQVKYLFAVHNAFLCLASLLMLVAIAYSVSKFTSTTSPFELFCDHAERLNQKGALWFWVYLFSMSKYYEFLDTMFLIVKKVIIIIVIISGFFCI